MVSIGKAGHSMALALAQILPVPLQGVVACPAVPQTPVPGLQYFFGGHPLPNEDSLRAAEAILKLLRNLPEHSLVIFLISGGASAIVECPIEPSLTLSDIVQVNRALVHSGASITEMNAIRKHLSAIKGGRMAQAAAPASQLSLLVSDVPDDSLDALASGPTLPDSTTTADCYSIAGHYAMLPQFPAQVRQIFENHLLQETPKPGDEAFRESSYVEVLSNRMALRAASDYMVSRGFAVEIDNSCDDWDYAQAAEYLLGRLRQLRQRLSPACVISGGEVTVRVGANSGIGGRNQQFALYCAQKICGESTVVLSTGTDGIDGNSAAAGAIVDGTTVARAVPQHMTIDEALAGFNAFPFLYAIGDTIITGPTGNNVRDLRILMAH